jgi:hypothetical protein
VDDIEQIAGYAEQALANDAWWYWLGYKAGYAEGRADEMA